MKRRSVSSDRHADETNISRQPKHRTQHHSTSSGIRCFGLFLVGILLVVLLVSKRGFGDEKSEIASETSFSSEGRSLFDRCSYPQHPPQKSDSMCTYFHPLRFFQDGQPGHAYRNVISDPYLYPSNSFSNWAWQVNNWPVGDGPKMQLSSTSNISPEQVQSVTGFSTPKAGSRTIYKLFLDYIAVPKKPIQKTRRLGSVSSVHLERLKQRQERSKISPQQQRRDVVFTVMRDPVARFLSAMEEIVSLRGSKRCTGCKKYLEPCLVDQDASTVLICTLTSIEENGFFNEHLIPHAVFLTRLLDNNDVEIAVFPLENLNNLSAEFGAENKLHANPRERKNVNADSNALSASFRSVLEEESSMHVKVIQKICALYQVDILIMKHLGFPMKYC